MGVAAGLGAKLWNLLSSRHATRFVIGAGLLLTAASLGGGVELDDRFLRAEARGEAWIVRAPWDLFHIFTGDPAEHAGQLERGALPWYGSPDLKTAFFRPIASLSAWADYTLLPQWPWVFHLENLLLFAALLALLLSLYRGVFPSAPLAALAGLLYAVDEAHGVAVAWLANRNALFASVFGVAAVLLHHRARAGGFRAGQVLAPLSLGLALLSGEAALGAFAYLVAYGLAFETGPLSRRLVTLAPCALVVGAWWLTIHALGYGVHGSGYYVDPVDEPLRFLGSFPGWLLAMTFSQFGLPPADLWFVWANSPWPVTIAASALAVLTLAAVGLVLWPLLRADRATRFWALGSGLALCLTTATTPSDRNMLFTGIGAFALIATVIGELGAAVARPRLTRWTRRAFIGVHLVLAPLLLPAMVLGPRMVDEMARKAVAPLAQLPGLERQTLVMVNATTLLMTAFYMLIPTERGGPIPARLRTLSVTSDAFTATRVDDRTLRLELEPGYFTEPTSGVVRPRFQGFHEGDEIVLPGTTFTVERIDERARPLVIRCRFEVPLEDESLRWMRWNGSALVAYRPPAVGESHRVTASP